MRAEGWQWVGGEGGGGYTGRLRYGQQGVQGVVCNVPAVPPALSTAEGKGRLPFCAGKCVCDRVPRVLTADSSQDSAEPHMLMMPTCSCHRTTLIEHILYGGVLSMLS